MYIHIYWVKMAIKFKIAGQEYTVDGAAEEDTLLRIEALVKKAMSAPNSIFDPKVQQNFGKAIKAATDASDMLNKSFDDLDTSVEDADKSFDDVVRNEAKREKMREDMATQFKRAIVTNIVSTSQYFAHSLQDSAHSLINSLTRASGPDDGVLAFSKVIDTTITVIADGIKAVASAIPYIGTAIAGLTGAAAESAKFLNDFLAGQLVNVIQSYGKITSEGILLADGITQLKKTANEAGVGVADFSEALSRNAQIIGQTGLGMTAGTEKFGQAITSLRNVTLGYSNKLFALGYNFQDQADIVAASMNNLAKTTNIQKLSGDQIAQQSYEYAKSLKIISDITGKTAKQQMEAQQAAQLNIAVQAKLAEIGPEAATKFNQMMGALPTEEARHAAEQFLVFGHAVSGSMAMLEGADAATAKAISYSTSVLTDSSVDAATASREVAGLWADAGQSLKTNSTLIAASTAGLADASGAGADLGKSMVGLQDALQHYTRDGIQPALTAEQKLTTNADSLTQNFAILSDDMLKFKSIIENDATNAVEGYSKILVKMADWIDKTLVKSEQMLGINNPQENGPPTDKDMGVWNTLMNAMISFFTGANAGPATMAARQAAAAAPDVNVMPAFADGGIASGSKSGFTALLHGTEAVVPLPNGNSIPVDFNADDLKLNTGNTRDENADHRSSVIDEKMLATLQALLNSQENGNDVEKQALGMSNTQGNLLRELVLQMSRNNDMLAKIYKTSY